jgi:prepilin-type N-terminal cleavage/methylation domain-containing protein
MSRGFTLVELLVAITVAAVLGVGLTRLMISDSRFVGRQDAMMDARQAARAAVTVLATDLRMVTGRGGILAAVPESVTVRIPAAFGLTCQRSADTVYAVLAPADPGRDTTQNGFGIAKLESGGYDFGLDPVDTVMVADTTMCAAVGVRLPPDGQLTQLLGARIGATRANSPTLSVGQIFFLYREMTYRFAPSVMVPGRVGLWYRAGDAPAVELAAPFDTTSRFAFLTGPGLSVSETPPGNLGDLRGLELRVTGMATQEVPGDDGPRRFSLTTRVGFANRSD